jgi:multiple sugar transport system permease protein
MSATAAAVVTPQRSAARRTARRRGIRRLIVSILIAILFLFPVYWMFAVSLKRPEEIFAYPPVWYPSDPQFGNFWVLFEQGDAWSVFNSLITASISTAIAMVLGTLCAYSIARFKTGGDNLAIWILSQRMLPAIAVVFPIFLVYAFLGWSDTYHGLILLYTAFALPYVIWMMRGYIQEVPIELEESALIDGCSRWQVLWRVVVPMTRSGLFATAVFAFIFSWNEFLFALVLTRTEITTFPVQITHYFGSQSTFWAKISAMSVLGTLPIFFAVATLQRFLVRGISMGAVKG